MQRFDAGKRIQVRLVADRQPVLLDWSRHLHGLEQLAGAAGEHRDAVGGRIQLVLEKARDPFQILVERFTFRRPGRICPAARGEFFAHECLELIAAGRTGLRVEIKADHRIWCRLERSEPVELLFDGHVLLQPEPAASDMPRLP